MQVRDDKHSSRIRTRAYGDKEVPEIEYSSAQYRPQVAAKGNAHGRGCQAYLSD